MKDIDLIQIYAKGIIHCSICVPKGLIREEIENEVNKHNPTGIHSRWKIDKANFSDGTENPHQCEDDKNREHYLMVC